MELFIMMNSSEDDGLRLLLWCEFVLVSLSSYLLSFYDRRFLQALFCLAGMSIFNKGMTRPSYYTAKVSGFGILRVPQKYQYRRHLHT